MKMAKRIISTILCGALLATQSFLICGAGKANEDVFATEEHITLSRTAADEGMVLLENGGSLPLKGRDTVAMFGCGQIRFQKGGEGSGDVNTPYVRSLLDGMQIKSSEGKIALYQPLVDSYVNYTKNNQSGEMIVSDQMIEDAAKNSNKAVITISRLSGEGYDRNSGQGDFLLTDTEKSLIRRVSLQFDKTIIVLNIGGIIDVSWISEYNIDAVLVAWQAGMEGGLAAADILCGDVNPSGKLADTFATAYSDYPSSSTWDESPHNDFMNHYEDIFVGYRYFETIPGAAEKVIYPFGYGLSYTNFEFSETNAVENDGIITVSTKITNTGKVAGKEVAQVYFNAPQRNDITVFLDKSAVELAAFRKTDLIQPGKSQTVTMQFNVNDMASYDDDGKTGNKSAYVLESGDYKILLGNSVRSAEKNEPCYTCNVPENRVTEQLTECLTANRLTKRLQSDGTYETLSNRIVSEIGDNTTVEAENYTEATRDVRVEKFETGNQGRCIAGLSGGSAEYDLNVAEGGDYQLYFRVANGYGDITNALDIYLGDEKISPQIDLKSSGDSQWYGFYDMGAYPITLPQGECKLTFKASGTCGNIDNFTLKKAGSTAITVAADKTTLIEAEHYMLLDSRARTESFSTEQGSGICIADLSAAGTNVTYELNVAEAGTYNLTLNAANGWSELKDMLRVEVNGTNQNVNITMPPTEVAGNTWHNYIDVGPYSITLPEGVCTLKFTSNGTCGNLNSFKLEKAAAGEKTVRVNATSGKIMLKDVYENPGLTDAFLAQMSIKELATLCSGQASIVRWPTGGFGNNADYGIPNSPMADGPAGIHTSQLTTAWPVATLLACTWNTDLLEQIGAATAEEGKVDGADIWLAPAMNIHRNILCGRNFEYYSEDPLISGKMAAAITKGCQDNGFGVAIKHFAVNNKESNRNDIDSRVSERALREIYLKGFEICVKEADPWSIMSSYNFINGQEASERYDLLTTVLRNEWGYKNLVMTDWGNNSFFWCEIKAGNNLKMPGGNADELVKAVDAGLLSRAEIENSLKDVLNLIMRTYSFKSQALDPEYITVYANGSTRISAMDYTWISSGIRPESCSDDGEWQNLGSLGTGEWMEYNVDVRKAGIYQATCRVASGSGGGSADIYIDGEKTVAFRNTKSTEDWQKWDTSDPFELTLPEGRHTIKFKITGSGMNLAWFELTSPEPGFIVNGNITAENITLDSLAGITVSAYFRSDSEFKDCISTAITDNEGSFIITNLPTGNIVFVANGVRGAFKDSIACAFVGRDDKPVSIALEPDTIIMGDMDGDGNVSVSDVVEMRKVIMSGAASADLLAAGDLDSDGKLTVSDVVALRKMIMQG